MKIGIQFVGIPGSSLLRYAIARRVHLRLRRYGPAVSEVAVRIEASGGNRGPGEERCRIITSGPGPTITAEGEGSNLYTAVELAIERTARRLLSHASERARPREALSAAE